MLPGTGSEAAQQFIGFDTGEYCFFESEEVDPARFVISGSFESGYDYAFGPSVLNSLDGSGVQNLIVFMKWRHE